MKELLRTAYLEKIAPYRGKRIIKVLVWQRRTGKTTLLSQIRDASMNKWLHINMEDRAYDHLRWDTSFSVFLEESYSQGIREYYIDEVQMIPHWERSINSLFAKYPEVDIFLTGSNSDLLSGELSTLLRGRYVEFVIFPFSYGEFCEYFGLERDSASWILFLKRWNSPMSYMLHDTALATEWTKNLLSTILLKDIIERYGIKDVFLLEEIFLFFVNNTSNLINLTNILNTLNSRGIKSNLTTLWSYLEYLKNSFLIYEAGLYDVIWKRILNRERKLYLSNPHHRTLLSSGYDSGLGKILENTIYLEARIAGYSVWVWRVWGREIDFILEKHGKKIYIQVAYLLADETVIERAFGNLRLIRDSWPKYVISMDEISFGTLEGIEHIRAWEMEKIFR
jgi:uncharacterized protein